MPSKILIVDDDPDIVLFLSTILQDHGYQVATAADGREGLEKATTERPDLILLDLMMPFKSGIALLNDLKEDDQLKSIPVIMVTGVSGETGIVLDSFFKKKGKEEPLNPVGFVEKPIDPDRLLALVDDAIERLE